MTQNPVLVAPVGGKLADISCTPNVAYTTGSGSSPSYAVFQGLGLDDYFSIAINGNTNGNGAQSVLHDSLGSTTGTEGPNGQIYGTYQYGPFGKSTVASGTPGAGPFQYTGRESDPTGLYYLRNRYYSPGLQRFISPDPLGFGGGDANLYAYVHNSPINSTDPTGLQSPSAGGGGGGGGTGAPANSPLPPNNSQRFGNCLGDCTIPSAYGMASDVPVGAGGGGGPSVCSQFGGVAAGICVGSQILRSQPFETSLQDQLLHVRDQQLALRSLGLAATVGGASAAAAGQAIRLAAQSGGTGSGQSRTSCRSGEGWWYLFNHCRCSSHGPVVV